MQKQIILIDDEALFRAGLKRILIDFGNYEIVQEASNGREFLQNFDVNSTPDLILLDLSMPVMDGVETLKEIIKINSELKVCILSSHYDPAIIVNMIELGAVSFFAKNEDPEQILKGIENIVSTGFHYTDYIVKLLREKMLKGKVGNSDPDLLSDREIEVLRKICEQKTAKNIGEELFISPRTVEGHRNNLLTKTNSRNIAGLIIFAVEQGIFEINLVGNFLKKT